MIQIINLKKNSKSGILPSSGSENGNVLLIVLMIALVTNILIFSAAFAGRSTMKKSGDSRVNVALLNLAEAGKEDGLARLKSGSVVPVSGSSIPVTSNDNFGGGAYTVSCSSNTTNDRVWLSSVATYTGKTKRIEAIYDITAGSIMSAAFDNAICAGGNITWTGSGNADAGTAMVHCNGSFTISGSSRITANLRVGAQLVRSGSSQIYGHVTTPYTPIQTGSGSITSVTVETGRGNSYTRT
jgi:Tfp pilus assembly protein PilX